MDGVAAPRVCYGPRRVCVALMHGRRLYNTSLTAAPVVHHACIVSERENERTAGLHMPDTVPQLVQERSDAGLYYVLHSKHVCARYVNWAHLRPVNLTPQVDWFFWCPSISIGRYYSQGRNIPRVVVFLWGLPMLRLEP